MSQTEWNRFIESYALLAILSRRPTISALILFYRYSIKRRAPNQCRWLSRHCPSVMQTVCSSRFVAIRRDSPLVAVAVVCSLSPSFRQIAVLSDYSIMPYRIVPIELCYYFCAIKIRLPGQIFEDFDRREKFESGRMRTLENPSQKQ